MAPVINIHEAKTHLSRIVEEVARGKVVVIGKAGKPLAKLVPIAPEVKRKKLGTLKGKIRVAKDFNAPLPTATLAAFGLKASKK
jgi:prevent-host-death family protein